MYEGGTVSKDLERAFAKAYGLGPKKYLTHKRLSRLRLFLKAGHGREYGVSDLFLRCGLTHFGPAAQAYGKLYGETPSTTKTVAGPQKRRHDSTLTELRTCTGSLIAPIVVALKATMQIIRRL
jgi:AraC-like DNA-binding protein